MYIQKREEIIVLLKQLEMDINKCSDYLFFEDSKCSSLVLWSKYQRYLNGILLLFEPKEKNDYKILENVITLLELDVFYVNASSSLYKSNLDLQKYIQRMKEILI